MIFVEMDNDQSVKNTNRLVIVGIHVSYDSLIFHAFYRLNAAFNQMVFLECEQLQKWLTRGLFWQMAAQAIH